MRQSKYAKLIDPLHQKPFFTVAEAEEYGIPRHTLVYLVKKGVLTRICPGIYQSSLYEPKVEFEWENLALAAASIPDGVICLISALCYYDLTDQIMREAWIAVAHQSRAPKRPNTRIVRMRNIKLGREKISLGEFTVQIFNRERCIVDTFRYLSKEIAIKALQRYFRDTNYKPQSKKLAEYAKALRINITPYILSCTT